MDKWEYLEGRSRIGGIEFEYGYDGKKEYKLNELGQKGWELAGMSDGHVIFKRNLTELLEQKVAEERRKAEEKRQKAEQEYREREAAARSKEEKERREKAKREAYNATYDMNSKPAFMR